MTLEELRSQIDALDRQLVELLSERARAALMIGHFKVADLAAGVRAGAREGDLRQCARGEQGAAARHRVDAYLRAHHRRDAGIAAERVGFREECPQGPRHWRTDIAARFRCWQSGIRARDRERSNDCCNAGEGYRRADRFRDRSHGGSRSRRSSDHGRNANHTGWRWTHRRTST